MKDTVLKDLFAFLSAGASADDLLEHNAREDSPELYDAALRTFGSWEDLLAEAVLTLHHKTRHKKVSATPKTRQHHEDDASRPPRLVGPDAELPLMIMSEEGALLAMDLPVLPTTHSPVLQDFPEGPEGHRPRRLRVGNPSAQQALVTDAGYIVGLDFRLIPWFEPDVEVRPLHYRWGFMDPSAVVADVFVASELRTSARFYSVTTLGQFKATDRGAFRRVGSEEQIAVLIKPGDQLLSVFTGQKHLPIFMGTSDGHAIVFDAGDVRSQGRKATGVRGIKLGAGAEVVGGFEAIPDEYIVVVTSDGLMKRMRVTDFRPQGRGGGGLQLAKLNPGARISAICSADLPADLVLLTNYRRFARFPVYDVPSMTRASKGDRLLTLREGEVVVQALSVPPGAIAE